MLKDVEDSKRANNGVHSELAKAPQVCRRVHFCWFLCVIVCNCVYFRVFLWVLLCVFLQYFLFKMYECVVLVLILTFVNA